MDPLKKNNLEWGNKTIFSSKELSHTKYKNITHNPMWAQEKTKAVPDLILSDGRKVTYNRFKN